jgi:hypothetical protein
MSLAATAGNSELDECIDGFANIAIAIQNLDRFTEFAGISLEHFPEEHLFVSEGRVETRLFNANGFSDLVEGGVLEPLFPEKQQRAVQRLLQIKTAGPPTNRRRWDFCTH